MRVGHFTELGGDFYIRIESRFESSHYLYAYFPDGSDEPIHGHSYKVELYIGRKGGGVGSDGISFDFVEARRQLDELTSTMDHRCINDMEEFKGINPTTENVARWFYAGLHDTVAGSGGEIREIRVYEGPHFLACFRPV